MWPAFHVLMARAHKYRPDRAMLKRVVQHSERTQSSQVNGVAVKCSHAYSNHLGRCGQSPPHWYCTLWYLCAFCTVTVQTHAPTMAPTPACDCESDTLAVSERIRCTEALFNTASCGVGTSLAALANRYQQCLAAAPDETLGRYFSALARVSGAAALAASKCENSGDAVDSKSIGLVVLIWAVAVAVALLGCAGRRAFKPPTEQIVASEIVEIRDGADPPTSQGNPSASFHEKLARFMRAAHTRIPPRIYSFSQVTVMHEIGAGAFGLVHLARLAVSSGAIHDVGTIETRRRPVAVKVVSEECKSEAVDDLLRETVTLCQFDHPNIVRVLGVVSEPQAMVILEFCERGNLHKMLSVESQYQTFTLEAKLKAVLDVATGMEAVASAGVVHCDLAARNVLVSHDFRFKVADFGMARSSNNIVWTPDPLFSGAEVVTFEFSATGLAERAVPIRWCAVEVIMEAKVSEASDVWSFGVLLWEIFSHGDMPYTDMTNSEVWMAVREGLRLHCPAGCPEEVYSVATACWRSDPSARPTFGSLRGYFSDLVHDETKSLEQPNAHNVETCSALVDAHFSSDVSNHIRRTSLFRESIKRTHHPSQFSFSSLRSQSADAIGQPSSFYGVVGASMSESYIQTLSDRGGSWDSSGTPLAELVDTPLSEIPDKYNQELTNLGLVDDVLGANAAAQFAASVSQHGLLPIERPSSGCKSQPQVDSALYPRVQRPQQQLGYLDVASSSQSNDISSSAALDGVERTLARSPSYVQGVDSTS
eukprot:m.16689 g.16689  ORF g.16689 m.16689 type:complete len:763 (-) comp5080_c0_seq2:70-2358(-)